VRRKHKVWYWNGEDPLEEIERRVAAICKHYLISKTDLQGQLFISSGREDASKIQIAYTDEKGGFKLNAPLVGKIERFIADRAIDVVIIDPFVRTHGVSENDNQKINAVVEEFARLADGGNCAIELVHHVGKTKTGDDEYTVLDGRGASALHAAARSMRVLNGMTADEAKEAGLRDKQRPFYFRVDTGKSNMAPPPDIAAWYHLTGVSLDNHVGDGTKPDDWPNDNVGVVTAFIWPEVQTIPAEVIRDIQRSLKAADYRADQQSPNWAGYMIAKKLGIKIARGRDDPAIDDEDNKIGKQKIKRLISKWIEKKYIAVVEKPDKKSELRKFLAVDNWAGNAMDDGEPM
jgi:hypothetical protein